MSSVALDFSIIGPAFLAGLLVLATHVPLGQRVLQRGIIFIDLAIAQIAGLGVIFAHLLEWEHNVWGVQLAAVIAAALGALLLTWTERQWPAIQEAIIGTVFILAATLGILMLANNPHGGEQLRDLLVGQILWVSYPQLLPVAVLTAFILAVWRRLRAHRQGMGFYLLFALAVTASVQLVGVYLVFASLIIPALATRHYSPGQQQVVAYLMGVAAYGAGLTVSTLVDLPPGPVIVWCLALMGLPIAVLAARRQPTA